MTSDKFLDGVGNFQATPIGSNLLFNDSTLFTPLVSIHTRRQLRHDSCIRIVLSNLSIVCNTCGAYFRLKDFVTHGGDARLVAKCLVRAGRYGKVNFYFIFPFFDNPLVFNLNNLAIPSEHQVCH